MASNRRGEAGQPILVEGALSKQGKLPGQWAQRYFVLSEHEALMDEELRLNWYSDNLSRLGGGAPLGCCYVTRSSTVAMKGADIMAISGVRNPQKPQKTSYNLKGTAAARVDEWIEVVQAWLARNKLRRVVSMQPMQSGQQRGTSSGLDSNATAAQDVVQQRPRSVSLPLHPAVSVPFHPAVSVPLSPSAVVNPILARALFAYTATGGEPSELSFPAGATLRVLEQADSGWWRGAVEGRSGEGWFPSNFVRRVSSRVVADKPACEGSVVLFHAVATHDFVDVAAAGGSSGQKELPLRQHEVVAVTATHSNGWWMGTAASGESGWFPSNYVEVVL